MTNYQVLKTAIFEKKQIHARYNGLERQMCPHILGTTDGVEKCLFYQFGGDSSGGIVVGSDQNWRCITVSELQNVKLVSGDWHSAKNYTRRPATCVADIDVQV